MTSGFKEFYNFYQDDSQISLIITNDNSNLTYLPVKIIEVDERNSTIKLNTQLFNTDGNKAILRIVNLLKNNFESKSFTGEFSMIQDQIIFSVATVNINKNTSEDLVTDFHKEMERTNNQTSDLNLQFYQEMIDNSHEALLLLSVKNLKKFEKVKINKISETSLEITILNPIMDRFSRFTTEALLIMQKTNNYPSELFVEGYIEESKNQHTDKKTEYSKIFVPKIMYYGKQRTFENYKFSKLQNPFSEYIGKIKNNLKYYNEYLRLKFLVMLILPFIFNIVLLNYNNEIDDFTEIVIASFSLVCLFIGLFLVSDYFDHISKKDEIIALKSNYQISSRFIQYGLSTPKRNLLIGTGSLFLGIISGIYLAIQPFSLEIIIIGILGILTGFMFALPPLKLYEKQYGFYLLFVFIALLEVVGLNSLVYDKIVFSILSTFGIVFSLLIIFVVLKKNKNEIDYPLST